MREISGGVSSLSKRPIKQPEIKRKMQVQSCIIAMRENTNNRDSTEEWEGQHCIDQSESREIEPAVIISLQFTEIYEKTKEISESE